MKNYFAFILLLFIAFYSCDTKKNEPESVEQKPKVVKEDVVFSTADNLKIHGTYYYSNFGVTKKEPLVILIHQFMSDRNQWKQEFIDSLVGRKFKVVTYDIRGHGESDKVSEKLEDVLVAKGNAILDLEAVFNWAKSRTGIDSTRISVVGTSVGASLGLFSKHFLGSKTVVCISIGKDTFESIMTSADLSMTANIKKKNSVLFICGDKDGTYPEDSKKIYTDYTDNPKELKFFNSDKHGKDLCVQFPEIKSLIIDWLVKNL